MNARKLKAWQAQHGPLLEAAIEAVRTRQPFSPFSDELGDYDSAQIEQGESRFRRLLDAPFHVTPQVPADVDPRWAGGERSPYGFDLGIRYRVEAFPLLACRAEAAKRKWQQLDIGLRCALLCEVITRLHEDTFLFAHVGMHTSGHGLFMGFHANAVHAQARALESVAQVLAAARELSGGFEAELVVGQGASQRLSRQFATMPVGLSLVYAGRVVPTWGAYPGLFASLAAGCPVVVVGHDQAVLPMALTVKALKAACAQVGVPHDIVNLFHSDDPAAYRQAALHPDVRLIDYMGAAEFGSWLRQHAWQARVMTQQSAQTPVFLHSTHDYDGMLENLAFGLCSFSAQLCTSPQTLYVLPEGIRLADGVVSVAQFERDLVERMEQVLARFPSARELLGALLDAQSLAEIRTCEGARFARVLRRAEAVQDPDYPHACIVTPSLIAVRQGFASSVEHYGREIRGPVSFLVQPPDLRALLAELRVIGQHHGALGLGLYTVDAGVEHALRQVSQEMGALLSINFCKNFYISQCAVFTDIHGGGTGAAANVTYGAPGYYHARLRMTEQRKLL
ncbi:MULTISPECIES: aldehyde dehydrogenase family protein [Pseudomonas]|jgi:phenylacetic acid degradation protein paaN|uniref:Aldehyde dehydrogenase family protein n=1 Tax=Pseudomonas juntendi TaxID=2666183 RepID=A0A7W2JHL1_9PSED|nr:MULTISPECIES: aldehyde dehydrogenase family protein [Pseudomonas]EGB96591.1 aldehyde dehydrogenase [Pseudomonas sp. TJI-51]MBA6059037.1 aldehyde dehydrogenase family protein [Pseudomonas juntendi]MBA6120271.1 aldehyde dehydrogenase family protein [Pseudomonas juntendi]MBA6125526.1 aldehyde dehydrogenase family protein [Pseudomonas juntendi]MBI6912959.1 aldehyde dehydrogenase family protein [Pseudomonas juntendi]